MYIITHNFARVPYGTSSLAIILSRWHFDRLSASQNCSLFVYFFEPMARIELATYSFAYTSVSAYSGGLDCIFPHEADPCQSFGPFYEVPRSCPLWADINRYSGFTKASLLEWAGFCLPRADKRSTMELLYHLSYIGNKLTNKSLNFLLW